MWAFDKRKAMPYINCTGLILSQQQSTNRKYIMSNLPTTLNKWQRREVATMQKMQHFGANYLARGLSMLWRSAPKKTQQAEILALAQRLGVDQNPEFIISDRFTTI
jgi:flagellar motor switch protein FliG